MTCKHCHTDLAYKSIYCHMCGKRQVITQQKHRRHRCQSQGSIVKLPNRCKPYWARLPADYSSGKPLRQSLGCYTTYKEADQAIAKALQATQQSSPQQKITLEDVYCHFTEGQYFSSLSASTQSCHRTAWKHLSSISNIPIQQINMDILQGPINNLRNQGRKRATLSKTKNLCSLLCREAIGMGLIAVNYGHYIQLGKDDTTPARPFTPSALQAIWSAADAGDRDAMATLVLIYTGMRPVELLSIDISVHLHKHENYRYIKTGSKTPAGINRIIPLPPLIHNALDTLIGGRSSGPLVPTPRGRYYRVDNWRSRRFNPLMCRLGLTGYTPYSSRHSYADLLKRNAVAPEIAHVIMGHEDFATTLERYHTTTDEDIARICAAVDGIDYPAF